MSNAAQQVTRSFRTIPFHGAVCGAIGAGTIAAWFFLVDLMAAQPLATPVSLGRAVLGDTLPTWQVLLGYSALHLGMFVVIGTVAATLVASTERAPSMLFAMVPLFVMLEVVIHVFTGLVAVPLLGSLAWLNIAVGNFIAAFVAGSYLWRRYPHIRSTLARQPLGVPVDS
jgi:hypothetical protein